jgi:hypothetical protein
VADKLVTRWRRILKGRRQRRDSLNKAIPKLVTTIKKRVRKLQPKPQRRVVPRSEWGASPPKSVAPMSSTTNGLFVHHTVAGAPVTVAGEKAEMRNLQRIAWGRGFQDISYSFIVFPSGRIYEGRGLNVAGAHTAGFNSTSYAVSAAGNYDTNRPTNEMVAAIRWLRRDYLKLAGKPLRPHRAVYSTACPGQHLVARLNEL